jgi:hypothetical protein
MASLSDLKRPLRLFLATVFALLLSYLIAGVREQRTALAIEGRLFERCVDGVPMGPVDGAIISTSIDAVTATTDANGRFRLVTTTPNFFDERHMLIARRGELTLKTPGFREGGPLMLAFSCVDSWRCARPGSEYLC